MLVLSWRQIALLYEAVTGVMPDFGRTPAAIKAAEQAAAAAPNSYPSDLDSPGAAAPSSQVRAR